MRKTAVEFIREFDDFLLIAHVSPDGDTLGSCPALYCALLKLGKRAQIACADPVPKTYRFLPHADRIAAPEDTAPFSCAIAVDCADLLRTGRCAPLLSGAQHTLNIDHHGTNPNFGESNYVEIAAATGELVYHIIRELGLNPDEEMATCLYAALATDTGNFSYRNTTPDTFRIMAELLESGLDLPALNQRLFRTTSLPRLRINALAIDRLELYCNNRLGFCTLSLADLASLGATREDCESVIDIIRDIDTVEVAAFLREGLDGAVRVSMRGKTSADVSRVAQRFGGGGHRLAAGCTIRTTLEEARALLLPELEALLEGEGNAWKES